MRKSEFKVLPLDWYVDLNRSFIKNRAFDYIEECEDMPFPPREKIKYCVRTARYDIKDKKYLGYNCYCYQNGKWWKYKGTIYIYNDLYVPQTMSHYDWSILRCPYKFLSEKAQKDVDFYTSEYHLDRVGRNVRKSAFGMTKRFKKINNIENEITRKN
jgi:hypothetical protein